MPPQEDIPPTSTVPAPESPNPDPATMPPAGASKSKKAWLIPAIVVLIVLIMFGLVLLSHGKHTANNTTTTKNGKTYVSNANDKNAAIKGVELDASLKSGYVQRSLTASDLATVQKQISDSGLADMVTANGETEYGTTQQNGGDAVSIFWGTTSSKYNAAVFKDKLSAYADSLYQKSGGSATNTTGQPIVVYTTTGAKYTLPCVDTTVNSSDGSAPLYSILCQGTLGSSHAYISYSSVADDHATAATALDTFVKGSKIEL